MTRDSSARGSKLGYLFQVRYALYLLLTADEGAKVAFEKLDDFQFEADSKATPQELLQFKHSINNEASLSNSSSELWKTIGNWCSLIQAGQVTTGTILTLITTSTAPEEDGNIASMLRPQEIHRDLQQIAEKLLRVADESRNKALEPHFTAFRALSSEQRTQLVSAIQILDSSSNIWCTSDKIKSVLLERPEHLEGIYERLEGWWFKRVVQHLQSTDDVITKSELLLQLNDIRDQFRADSLPIDFTLAEPPPEMFQNQERLQFVQQLTMIALAHPRIELAIQDYYRAFVQRTKWVEEKLVNFGELAKYEEILREEWNHCQQMFLQEMADGLGDDKVLVKIGQDLYNQIMVRGPDRPVRPNMPLAPFVMRGTYHILADKKPEPRVWWHPRFIERLREVLGHPLERRKPILQPLEISTNLPSWELRSFEIANLLNPAFCAVMLYDAIKGYQSENNSGCPYAILFFFLPVMLHKPIRELLPRSIATRMHPWLQKNQVVLPGFPQLLQQFNPFTKEALIFGMQRGALSAEGGQFAAVPYKKVANYVTRSDTESDWAEVVTLRRRAHFVGRWFAQAGGVTSIFSWWGIRP
jgi:hypothetical protein